MEWGDGVAAAARFAAKKDRGQLAATREMGRALAVLVNCNARSVDGRCLSRLRATVGAAHVYASHGLDEAEAIAREVVGKNYRVVACGGGDGTLADAICRVLRQVRLRNTRRRLHHNFCARPGLHGRRNNHLAAAPLPVRPQLPPAFAFLPLGTGNALKHVVHAGCPYLHLAALADGRRFARLRLPLIEDQDGQTFFFGGMGYDSMLLHDYNRLLQQDRPAWAQPLVRSLAGYLAALGRDTLPRLLAGDTGLRLRVVAHGEASYFDPRQQDAAVALPPDALLYDGPASMLGVATVPYFGYGMRAFPFAERLPGRMQLRIARLGAPQVLGNLAAIWQGRYRNPKDLLDFAVKEVRVQLQAPFPFERSGDDCGPVDALRLRVGSSPIDLLDFARPLQDMRTAHAPDGPFI